MSEPRIRSIFYRKVTNNDCKEGHAEVRQEHYRHRQDGEGNAEDRMGNDQIAQAVVHAQRGEEDQGRDRHDDFAARFYLNLLPPPDRTLRSAEAIVAPLFARLLLRDEVIAAIEDQPAADQEVQAACLELARNWSEPGIAARCNLAGWFLVRDPGQPAANYRRGLRMAKAACQLEPLNGGFLNTLGIAQYRCGRLAESGRRLVDRPRTRKPSRSRSPQSKQRQRCRMQPGNGSL